MTQTNTGSSTTAAEYKSQPVLLLRNLKNDDQQISERFALEKFRLTIGRSENDDIRLPEGSGVSRNHARVFVLEGEVVIEDLSSRNGTFVNRKLIRGNRQTTLKFGDVIIIGRYSLKLIDESAQSEPDDTLAIHNLLRIWNAAAVVPVEGSCALCKDATGIDDNDAPPESATEPEWSTHDDHSTHDERPDSGRSYRRKSLRRQKVARRRLPLRQSTLLPIKRSMGAAWASAQSEGRPPTPH